MLPRLVRLSRLFSSIPNSQNPNPKNPYPKTLNETINKLFHQRDLDKLVSEFKKCAESYRFRCRHRIYEVTVRRLAAAGRPDAVEEIIEDQKRYPDDIAREGFGIRLISLYGKASMPDHAFKTFQELPSLNSPRTVKSFNALLTVFADCGEYDRIAEAIQQTPPSVSPNVISYSILIRALCDKGDLDAALETLDLMKKNGVSPNLVCYNILLTGFYGSNRLLDAEKIWNRLQKEKIEPDIRSFNAKLRGFISQGNILQAVEIVDELRLHEIKPNIFTYNFLIEGYCKSGKLDKAKKTYCDLLMNDCAPNKGTFEVLIPSLSEAGDLDMAFQLCDYSLRHKHYVDAAVLQGLVDSLVKDTRIEEAKKVVELGRSNRYPRKSLKMPQTCLVS